VPRRRATSGATRMPLAIENMEPISVNLLRLHARKTKEALPAKQPLRLPQRIDLNEHAKKYPLASTLLTACVSNGDVSRVTELIEIKGVDPNSLDQCGEPMLSRACMNGHTEMARLLLRHGADPIGINPTHSTALHHAADRNRNCEGVVKLLLEYPAVYQNLQMIDVAGDTPLILAAKHGTSASVELLLAAGADPNFLDAGQKSPLALAVEHKKKDNVEALKKHGAKPHKHWNLISRKYETEPTYIAAN